MEGKKQVEGDCSGWEAWYDHESDTQTLHVRGTCTFRTDGYSVELKPKTPKVFNPSVHALERVVHEPTGPTAQVITTEEVHYEEVTDKEYERVLIWLDEVYVDVGDRSNSD